MKKQDLRIGNYISDINANKSFYAEVKKLEYSSCTYGWFSSRYADLKPIPLTEEWLLSLGFDKKGNKGKIQIILKGKLGYFDGRTYFNSWAILEHQPTYVHELQNLYYALTGEELKIK
jgi:hypothetical protein